jgi:hypothetical protein
MIVTILTIIFVVVFFAIRVAINDSIRHARYERRNRRR